MPVLHSCKMDHSDNIYKSINEFNRRKLYCHFITLHSEEIVLGTTNYIQWMNGALQWRNGQANNIMYLYDSELRLISTMSLCT